MKSTYAFALSLVFFGSALSHSASAKQISIGNRSVVRSCDITTPGKLNDAEKAQLEAKGYRLKKDRSEYKHERFLGVYEYYEMKDSSKKVGELFLNAILVPYPRAANAFSTDVTLASKREFRLMVYTGQFDSTLAIVSSAPARLARTAAERETADFSSLPPCHD